MTGASTGPRLARRLTLTRADLDVLGGLLPGELPEPLLPTSSLLGADDDEASRAAIVDALVELGVLERADTGPAVVAPFARTWDVLAGAPTAVQLVVSGRGPDPASSTPVGQHAWIALDREGGAGASMRTLDPRRVEVSAFLPADLAAELGVLVPAPGAFGAHRSTSISAALGAPRDEVHPVGSAPDRVPGDSPEARDVVRSAHATLRCTVMARTPRGPGVGTVTWVATPSAWWQVDQDWRRWARTGEREDVLTRVPAGRVGAVLAGQVETLLRAGAGLADDVGARS